MWSSYHSVTWTIGDSTGSLLLCVALTKSDPEAGPVFHVDSSKHSCEGDKLLPAYASPQRGEQKKGPFPSLARKKDNTRRMATMGSWKWWLLC